MLPLAGVIAIIYGVFSLLSTLSPVIFGGESQYAKTERVGVETPGRIESIVSQNGNGYIVQVTFTTSEDQQLHRNNIRISNFYDKPVVPSDVTVIYLPGRPREAFIQGFSPVLSDSGEFSTKILHSLAFIGGGALFLYIFGGWLSSYGRSESVDTH